MARTASPPAFRELERSEIDAILSRNHLGRIGYARGNRVEVQPVNYVYADGWLYGRTSYGAKYDVLAENQYRWWPVAFEVDEVDDLFNWRSVLVHGGFYVIDESEPDVWQPALALLRVLIPATFGPDDPFAFRTVVFRIAVQEASGRACQRG